MNTTNTENSIENIPEDWINRRYTMPFSLIDENSADEVPNFVDPVILNESVAGRPPEDFD